MPCLVCGSERTRGRFSVRTTRLFHIVECRACGLAFAFPRPTDEEFTEFYTDSYFAEEGALPLGYEDYRGSSWAEANARAMWHELHHWFNLVPPDRSVLDIGCATGAFLSEAKHEGWRVLGVERAGSATAVATGEFGVPVVDDIGDVTERFGLVTMWQVLEHLPDPLGSLRAARDRLMPRGYLLIEVPNWRSLGRRRNGVRWSQLRPPEHINFFDRKSLRCAVEQLGLSVVSLRSEQPSHRNRALELGRRGSSARAAALLMATAAVSRTGLGGYLRCLAQASR